MEVVRRCAGSSGRSIRSGGVVERLQAHDRGTRGMIALSISVIRLVTIIRTGRRWIRASRWNRRDLVAGNR